MSFYSLFVLVLAPLPIEVHMCLKTVQRNVFLFVVVQMFSFFQSIKLLLRTGSF